MNVLNDICLTMTFLLDLDILTNKDLCVLFQMFANMYEGTIVHIDIIAYDWVF